ncbi:MAG: PAS domain-containing sensor histidine kinase [Proteobacteria bacterium]|nr:PAS domain-containing sensor histidine kinase [Pseudomonadota bacterium]
MPVKMGRSFVLGAVSRELRSGVLVLDSCARVLYANPYILRYIAFRSEEGLSEKGVEGRELSSLISNPTLLATVEAMLAYKSTSGGSKETEPGAVEPEEVEPEEVEIEIEEGGRSFSVRGVPINEGEDFTLLLFLNDITEEKRLEAIKRDFVANVSHELRTPLAAIKGYSETLLDGGVDDEETSREFLRVIDRHATRMSRLIDDLLTLSRLESQQMAIVPTPVDLSELLSSTQMSFRKHAEDKGVTLSAEVPENLPVVSGDRDRLEQVVVNLLDNAIKYTPEGGSVILKATLECGAIKVEVIDTGIGIPEADMPRIFERFYRVDKARSRDLGGTGLGLAIVKHIMQGHNGTLNVESSPGVGTTFSFTLKAS